MGKKKKNKNSLPQDVQEAAEKVFMAGVGALSVAEEEGSKLFKKLVKKGKKYDGDARKEVEQIRTQLEGQVTETRKQIEGQVGQTKKQVEKVKQGVDAQTDKVMKTVDAQIDRVMKVADDAVGTVEHRVQDAVTAALQGLGIPTRDEIAALRKSVQQLSKNLDALKHERTIAVEAEPAVEAASTGNGWYEIRVRGVVVDKAHGEEAAADKVSALLDQDAALTNGQRDAGAEAVKGGGGWYTIKLNGLSVDKVQGQEAADTRVAELEAQR